MTVCGRYSECVADIEQVMQDNYHLLPACYRVLAEDMVRYVEERRTSKRTAERSTEQKSKQARNFKTAPRRNNYESGCTGYKRPVLVTIPPPFSFLFLLKLKI